MPTKLRRKSIKRTPAGGDEVGRQRPEDWDRRLRLIGDARFIDVEWSGRDHPVWPLPITTQEEP